jgi:5-methylcytosine-specific restriction endonuclease McrA
MDRYRQVTFQPGALRSVVKQAHGVAASATGKKPLHNFGEETVTRASGGPKGQRVSYVFVVDIEKRALDPVHPGHARRLLTEGKAAVFRRYPFTIILKQAVPDAQPESLRLKIDPGSKTTGLVVVNDRSGDVIWAAELSHRGQQIRDRLLARRATRRSRRQRHTRYRKPRFHNRRRRDGWLPPSLTSRVQNVLTWVNRVRRLCPVGALSQELVRFDTQLMQHAEIAGVEYQQGELAGYEVREYLLEKWGRMCAYCEGEHVPLEIEHIVPKTRGGSYRVSNLTLACRPCNDRKGNHTATEVRRPDIQARAKQPLKDATAVNATRWALYHALLETGLPLEVGTSGRTKWNRIQRNLPKTHWLDAACVGASTPPQLQTQQVVPLLILATGRESRQMCRMDRDGFPRTAAKSLRHVQGFQTGDLVRAVVPHGSNLGTHVGRVAVRASGKFNVTTKQGTVQGVAARHFRVVQHADGYRYEKGEAALPPLGLRQDVSVPHKG